MKQRLPFLRNRSLYRRRTIKFDRFDPSLVETPFIDLSFRVARSPFQRRRSEKRPTSVFQKRRRAEFPPTRPPLLGEVNATRKRNAYSFVLSNFKRVALTRRVRFILSSTRRRLAYDLTRFTYFLYFSDDVKRRFRSFSENVGDIRFANKRASTTKFP